MVADQVVLMEFGLYHTFVLKITEKLHVLVYTTHGQSVQNAELAEKMKRPLHKANMYLYSSRDY